MTIFDAPAMRDELHKIPELGFEEVKTSEYVAQKLTELGIEVRRGVGGTGVLGTIHGTEPGPVVLLRADMDALPFKNADGSIERVHACGHDGHTAMLLAAASHLVGKVRRGTLKLLFQPAEETLSGALAVIKDGVIDDVDIALGLHVRPVQDIPAGTCCAAVWHTSSIFVEATIEGLSAHASRPHLGVNAAEGAALFTLAVAAIKLNPNLTWSCKVTGIDAMSSASNIIPDKARIMIDARAQTNELMDEMLSKIDAAVKGAAAAIGGKGSTRLMGTVIPAAEYDEELVDEVRESITRVLGADKLAHDCGAGGEDFHFFKKHKPSIKAAYFGVGAGCAPGLHSRNMNFESRWLENGVKVLVDVALKQVG